jgi:hypothetical protein
MMRFDTSSRLITHRRLDAANFSLAAGIVVISEGSFRW